MKKLMAAILTVALLLALGLSATAATTSIMLDGKQYTFFSEYGSYEADGKTFVLEGDSVRVKEAGKPDRVFMLEGTAETDVIQDVNPTAGTAQSSAFSTDTEVAYDYITGAVASMSDTSVMMEEGDGDPAEKYLQYEPYGLTYDAASDILTLNGQRVRIFEDSYPIGDNGYSTLEHCDFGGTIDVVVSRDLSVRKYNPDGSYDPAGQLKGLSVLSAEDFASRDLTPWTNPQQTAVATSGQPMTPAEKAQHYAPYRSLGITYDEFSDRLIYQNQTVRRFLDVKQSNGEEFASGRFKGAMTSFSQDYGTIDISILRDYTKPDSEGNGTITGVQVTEVK